MNSALAPYLRIFVLVFFDDILIYNNTLEEHLVHIRLVFELLVKDEWKIKLSKCTLHKEKSTIWGMSLVKKV
jgi:hypothetical protein